MRKLLSRFFKGSGGRSQRFLSEHAGVAEATRDGAAALALALERRQKEELSAEVARLRSVERDLLDAKRNAEAAALSKGEFLATMSHEIRTPLNGILPILELVLGAPMEDEVRRQVSAAFESAKEMRRIVDDVLDFSKMEAGALRLEQASMRPIELVQSVCSLMKRSADAKGLRLVCEIDASTPAAVRGDALRLRQVLTNLIGNAIKFTSSGSVRVEVSQTSEDRTHRTLRVAVTDTGIGIAPDVARGLFNAFAQGETSMARTHGGTGLGLAICKRIVDLMGGRIGVESSYGRGSTFWFAIPMLRAAGEAPNVLAGDRHAFLLSRDDDIRESWTRHLASLEIRSSCFATAYEVLSSLRATLASRGSSALPQLVVIDLASSSKTAASVVRPLLNEEAFAPVRILLLGQAREGIRDTDDATRTMLAERELPEVAAHQTVRRLLADPSSAEGLDAAEPQVVIAKEPVCDFTGLRVLLVDDIAINRYAGQLTLLKLGCSVTLASGGREAIAKGTEGAGYDVVLLDCQMPDVDGFAVARVLRLHEAQLGLQRTPILAVTANAMPGDRERCLEAGMDDHLAKPFDSASLSRMLLRWVQSRPSGSVARISGVGDGERGPVPHIANASA